MKRHYWQITESYEYQNLKRSWNYREQEGAENHTFCSEFARYARAALLFSVFNLPRYATNCWQDRECKVFTHFRLQQTKKWSFPSVNCIRSQLRDEFSQMRSQSSSPLLYCRVLEFKHELPEKRRENFDEFEDVLPCGASVVICWP